MGKVRFNLFRGNTLRLVLRHSGGQFVFYTGLSVEPGDWNPKKQEVRKGSLHGGDINAALHRLRMEVDRIRIEHLGTGAPIIHAELKTRLDKFWRGKDTTPRDNSAAAYIRRLATDRLASAEIQPATAKMLHSLASAIERFNPSLKLDEINLPFHSEFTAFLVAEKKAPNTIAAIVKRLKNVMGQAVDSGVTTNQAFRSARFRSKSVEVDNVYLTADEVAMLENLHVDGLERMVRDSFLLGVYTGLRYSDFSELKPEDFSTHKGVFMLKKRMAKTSRVVAVPINAKARAILETYGMQPPTVVNQVMNRYLKRICQRAGIDELVKTEPIRGGIRSVAMRPKWSMVSTHTARRSFSTISYLHCVANGLPIDGIMDITGHKSRVDFMKYIKVSAEEKAAAWVGVGG